ALRTWRHASAVATAWLTRCAPARGVPSAWVRVAPGPPSKRERTPRGAASLQAWEAQTTACAAESAGRLVHLRSGELLSRTHRLVDRREDHVLEHLDVVRVDRLGVDPDLLELEVA